MRVTRLVLAVVSFVFVVTSCRGEKDPALAVDLIDDAVAEVADVLGVDPVFFEINATPELVNLFVDDRQGNAINFVYDRGGLAEETTVAPADGITFQLENYVFDESIYAIVEEELPGSLLRAFIVVAQTPETESLEGDELYRVVIQSERGGQFAVLVNREGKILGSDPQAGVSGF
jgi:hypothetical protein